MDAVVMGTLSPRACLFLTAVAVLMCGSTSGQEICANGVDDDSDGLIDLNDTLDCLCASSGWGSEVLSIIPNPSFEEYSCLPVNASDLFCATGWEQATDGTSDYFHNLGYLPNSVPLPIPNGDACAGGYIERNRFGPGLHYLEYVGACLPQPLLAGQEYTLHFNIAGVQTDYMVEELFPITVGPVPITLFGLPVCVPFPLYTNSLCPLGWSVLGTVNHQPDGTWHDVAITFTPPVDMNTVMLGGPCEPPTDYDVGGDSVALYEIPYFFYDNLVLNTSTLFSTITLDGSICSSDAVLMGHPAVGSTSYQWYLEGVALVGETDSLLDLYANGLGTGEYQFATVTDTTCIISSFVVEPPTPIIPLIVAEPAIGCAPLLVSFEDATVGVVIDSCIWSFGDNSQATGCDQEHLYTQPGSYDVTLFITTAEGCTFDTTYVDLITAVAPPTAGITATPQPAPVENPVITFVDNSSVDAVTWEWDFDTIAPYNANTPGVIVTYPSQPGTYPVVLIVTNAEGCSDTVWTHVVIGAVGMLEMPNVFSPNGDGVNDVFIPVGLFPGDSRLTIFNRWGQEVFVTTKVTSGWNGKIEGALAPEGTYYWVGEGHSAVGVPPVRTGHVTLLR